MNQPVFRFAPSPNGFLHLGHAYSALVNAEMAAAVGGRLRVRTEDIDVGRSRPEFVDAIFTDLAWLGLQWETPVRRQSQHFDDYRAALAELDAQGLTVRSYATRREIAAGAAEAAAAGAPWLCDPDGTPLFPGDHSVLAPAEVERRRRDDTPFAVRLDMRRAAERVGPLTWREIGRDPAAPATDIAADPLAWGDVVLARKDTPTSYHLAVVVDDAAEGITHVVRGRDLYHATAVHRLLQTLLGLPVPIYHHHALILDADGRKLSKSRGDTALSSLCAAGWTAADIRRRLGFADNTAREES